MGKKQSDKKIQTIIILWLIIIPVFLAFPTVLSAIPDYDVNMDGSCNILDLIQVSTHIGETGAPGWIREDVDKNGYVRVLDMILVSNHYGESGWTDDTSHIQKLTIAYGSVMGITANQEFIASHFDMVDCNNNLGAPVTNVKTINPDIKIIGYYDSIMMATTYSDWSTVDSHEDWFVHDIYGNRIIPTNYPNNRLMNPNSGWSDYYAQKCLNSLQNYPSYDGIFADDVSIDLQGDGYSFTVPFSDFEAGVITNWDTWMIQHIQNVQTTIGNKMLMPNAWKHMELCEQATNVTFWEGFIHGRSTAYDSSGYGSSWSYGLLAINLLHEQASLGNVIAVNSGCKDADGHPVEAKEWMLFTYACFSFAVVDLNKAYYSWQFYSTDSTHGYYSEMETNLGQPIGDYYHVTGTNRVYAREFVNYYVAANLDPLGSGDATFIIDGTSHTLSPRTAVFIQK